MRTYLVIASRGLRGWNLFVEGFGITRSNTLREAASSAQTYLALEHGEDARLADVSLRFDLGGLEAQATELRVQIELAARMQQQVAERSREIVKRLYLSGLSGADTAFVMGISPQRVSQLVPKTVSSDESLEGLQGARE